MIDNQGCVDTVVVQPERTPDDKGVDMATKKPSRRQAQRVAAGAVEASHQAVELLPESLEAQLGGYQPTRKAAATWDAVQPVLFDVMRRSHIRGEASFKKHLGVVATYLTDRAAQSKTLNVDVAFSSEQIDNYYLHAMGRYSARTRNDYRSRLNKVAVAIVGDPSLQLHTPTIGRRSVRPGYNTIDEARIRRVALRQRSPLRRRQMCAIVGLSMGAGLSSTDLRGLRRKHVVDHDTDGIEIQIPGNTARVVWVRANYDSFVRAGIEGLRANQFLIGEQLNRRNVTGNIFSHADNHDAPHLDASRMRSTWLAWLLNQHAPIGVILQAAGLKTARTLTDLAATTTTGTSDADSNMLRGADQ